MKGKIANVKRGGVERCRTKAYGAELLDVEDGSAGIRPRGSTIIGGSTIQPNDLIFVVNNSRKATIGDSYRDGHPSGNKPHFSFW